MSHVEEPGLLLGEFRRLLDERFRLSLPAAFADRIGDQCMLVKEQHGSLSLWQAEQWELNLTQAVQLVEEKLRRNRLEQRRSDVQQLSRLLSCRHRAVSLSGKSRLSIPEGFREFLGVEPSGEVFVVGAGLCVEIWNPTRWLEYQSATMPGFATLLEDLSG